MLFLGLLSCDIFVRLLDQPSKRRESAYVLITALLLYTHLYGVFVIVAQNLAYLAAQNRIPWRRWIMLQIASVALFSPWLPVAVRWMRSVNAGFWVPPMTLDAVPEAFWFYCGSDAAVLLLAAIAVLAFYGARKPEEHVRVGLTLSVSLMLLPVVIPVIVSMFSTPSFTYRYGIIAPAALYLLAACGIAALRFRALQVVMTIALATLLWRGDAADWRKPDWRGAANFLETNMRPGDIAAVNNRRARYLYDYYVHRRDIRRMAFDGDAVPLDLPRPQGQHVWLVLHDPSVPPRDILARGGWRVISQKAFHNVLVLELADH
jgi:hypothetical protein